jgi:hypothetical protein
MSADYIYDVAISFAQEDKHAAQALALALELKGFTKVYYYPNQRAATWGRLLKEKLEKIYSTEARYVIVLFSYNYFDSTKEYVPVEFAAIKKRISREAGADYMLPVKLNANENLEKYIELTRAYLPYNPKNIAAELIKYMGKPPRKKKIIINLKIQK